MIELRGTSHIAGGDLSNIRRLIEEKQPDVVALELDERRLQALLGAEQEQHSRNPFFVLMKQVQDLLGSRAGTMPGSDMLEAFGGAVEQGTDVALIDQDITVTLQKLRTVSVIEKFKFAGFLVFGMVLFPFSGFDLQEVPEQELVQHLLVQFRVSFPGMYAVLVEERNHVMAEKLQLLDREYDHVLAFVGAGHVEGISELLRN